MSGELVFRGGVSAGSWSGSIGLYSIDFTDGSVDAVTMGTGAIGRYRAHRVGGLVALSLQFLLGSGASLGSWPLCVRSTDLPAAARPRTPDAVFDTTGQTDWSGHGSVSDPGRAPDPTVAPGAFGWSHFDNIPTPGAGPDYPIGVWQVSYLMDASTGDAIVGIDSTTGSGMLNMGGTSPFGEALSTATKIQASVLYEAA